MRVYVTVPNGIGQEFECSGISIRDGVLRIYNDDGRPSRNVGWLIPMWIPPVPPTVLAAYAPGAWLVVQEMPKGRTQ